MKDLLIEDDIAAAKLDGRSLSCVRDFMAGYTFREIGERHGKLSPVRASQILSQAFSKIRRNCPQETVVDKEPDAPKKPVVVERKTLKKHDPIAIEFEHLMLGRIRESKEMVLFSKEWRKFYSPRNVEKRRREAYEKIKHMPLVDAVSRSGIHVIGFWNSEARHVEQCVNRPDSTQELDWNTTLLKFDISRIETLVV